MKTSFYQGSPTGLHRVPSHHSSLEAEAKIRKLNPQDCSNHRTRYKNYQQQPLRTRTNSSRSLEEVRSTQLKNLAAKFGKTVVLSLAAGVATGSFSVLNQRGNKELMHTASLMDKGDFFDYPKLRQEQFQQGPSYLRGTEKALLGQGNETDSNQSDVLPESYFQVKLTGEKACALPTFGGWHKGDYVAQVKKDGGWHWRDCAMECAKTPDCEYYTLRIYANDTCLLMKNKGEYLEEGYHYEGDKNTDCLDAKAKIAGPEFKEIHYVNMDKHVKRRENMENQLKEKGVNIPYFRAAAVKGSENATCRYGYPQKKCMGVAGLTLSYLQLIEALETKDYKNQTILVIEDDAEIDIDLMRSALSLVPDDWDVLRYNCAGNQQQYPPDFNHVNGYVTKTEHTERCNQTNTCQYDFYGGTVFQLWNTNSLEKLKSVWDVRPFHDVDGLLTTSELNSYCVLVGDHVYHNPPKEEYSAIQLDDGGNVTIKWHTKNV